VEQGDQGNRSARGLTAPENILAKKRALSSPREQPEFNGKVAWILGAAGTLGSATAAAFAAAGAQVVLSSRRAGALREVVKSLPPRDSARAHVVPVDIASDGDVVRAARRVKQRLGRIDILVNCTAAPIFGDFLSLTDSDWETVLQAKLLGYVRTMRAVIPYMIEQGAGSIVNVSGRGGRQPTPAHLPGCCANIAVNALTKGLADRYAANKIRINAVAPGPIESERHHEIARNNAALKSPGATKLPPLGRLGAPADIADAVLFLASSQSSFITGITLQVDGGGTAAI